MRAIDPPSVREKPGGGAENAPDEKTVPPHRLKKRTSRLPKNFCLFTFIIPPTDNHLRKLTFFYTRSEIKSIIFYVTSL
jgi:hypothetical protein